MRDTDDDRFLSAHDALLWCLRLWAAGLRQPIAADHHIAAIFHGLGAPEGAAALTFFLTTLRAGARRPLGLNCLRRPLLSADERALLQVLALAQHGRRFEALLSLREFVLQQSGQLALQHAGAVGAALKQAGHRLRPPGTDVRHFVLATSLQAASPETPDCAKDLRAGRPPALSPHQRLLPTESVR